MATFSFRPPSPSPLPGLKTESEGGDRGHALTGYIVLVTCLAQLFFLITNNKYLDVNIHPDTCSAIRPLYSVPVSLLSPEPQLDNAESRSLDPYDFLAQQLS